ncbi:MAG TPA: SgcJ/EcaC family oxidoreductase [Bryobacteraceae bacterium]|nr:SgcJ/EcaC family oxidoreductase [Bryobacteraceae bacterium]
MMALTCNAIEGREIRTLMDARAKAVRARDVDASVAGYAPDLLLFDVVNPLQYLGRDNARKRAAEWFASFEGPVGYEVRDLTIDAGEDTAFSHSLNRVIATTRDGMKLDMWWRSTVCYRKFDGKWHVTHEHNSVPFDVTSGKAALDLKP